MSEVTSLQKFQEEENKKLKQISDMQGVDLGVARTMLDQSRNPTFPSIDQPVKTRQDWMNEILLFDAQRNQAQSQPRQVSRPDFLAQARQEVRPQFDRAVGQLTQQVEGTRRQLPQQLASRGQALGGLRGQQEDTLTRDLAYGTADLRAQGEMAALQRADVLGQRYTEEQRYQDEVNFRERSFAEQQQMNQFSRETTLRQLENQEDQFAYQKERDLIADEWQQISFDEDVRRFGLDYAIKEANLAISQAQLTMAKEQHTKNMAISDAQLAAMNKEAEAKGVDTKKLAPYMSMLEMHLNDNNQENALAYVDNLTQYGLSAEEINYIKGVYGYKSGATTREGVVNIPNRERPTTTSPSRFIMPNSQVANQTGVSVKDLQAIDDLIVSSIGDPSANPTATKNQVDSLYTSGALGSIGSESAERLLMSLYMKYGLASTSTTTPQPTTGGGTTTPTSNQTGSR